MFCRNCGREVLAQAVACPGCGMAPRQGTKFCPNCAGPTQPNQVACTKCGVGLAPAGVPRQKPGKVTAIAVMVLINGILNLMYALSLFVWGTLSCLTIVGIIWGLLMVLWSLYPAILGVLEIVYAARILPNPIETSRPAKYISVMEIINIIACDFLGLVVGILSLVFYSEPEVVAYFRSREGRAA